MNRFTSGKLIAYLAVIFVAGGATGAVLTLRNTREQPVQAPSMDKTCNRLQDRLVSKLGLTPVQVQKLQPVFDQTAQALREAHSNAMCQTDQIIRRAHERIALELTPEQKARLEAYDLERQKWLRHRLKDCEQPKPARQP